MSDEKVYYIGQQKIVLADSPKEGWIKYGLEDNKTDLVTVEQFNNMKSETAYDDGQVRVKKWIPITAKMLKILLEAEMPMGEKDFVMMQLNESIFLNYEKAVAKLFKRKDTDSVRFSQAHEVLQSTTELIND